MCVSDEELEDYKALLYLPIAPEVEDPEENPFGPPPDGQGSTPEDGSIHNTSTDKKQRQPSADGVPPKKKARTTTIELQGVPSDGEIISLSILFFTKVCVFFVSVFYNLMMINN